MNTFRKNKGFTLIELLVVVAIIAIVGSLVFSSCNKIQRTRHARHYTSQQVKVRRTADGHYCYYNNGLWYYLMGANNSYYSGSLNDYRSSGATWQRAEPTTVPTEIQEAEARYEANPTSPENQEGLVSTEIDVAPSGEPASPDTVMGADADVSSSDSGGGFFDSSPSDSSSSDSGSFSSDSGGSFDSGGSSDSGSSGGDSGGGGE